MYKAYPKAYYILVEPLIDEYSDSIEKIKNVHSCEVLGHAHGESSGEMEINLDTHNLQKASLFERTDLTKDSGVITTKKMEIKTLDNY